MHVVISPPDRRVWSGRLRSAGTCDVKTQQRDEDRTWLTGFGSVYYRRGLRASHPHYATSRPCAEPSVYNLICHLSRVLHAK